MLRVQFPPPPLSSNLRRTSPFHGENMGSIPIRGRYAYSLMDRISACEAEDESSTLSKRTFNISFIAFSLIVMAI